MPIRCRTCAYEAALLVRCARATTHEHVRVFILFFQITIGHDNTGHGASWHLDHVVVENLKTKARTKRHV